MSAIPRFLDAPDVGELHSALVEFGAVIIERAVRRDTIEAIAEQCCEWFDRTPVGEGEFFGRRTRRFGGVLAKVRAAAALAVAQPILRAIDTVLRDADAASGHAHADCIQLNLMQAIAIEPGENAQILHRDDALFPISPGFEVMANVMWALDDFTSTNGATRVVPGSHRWPRDRRAAPNDIVTAEMPKGSALLWLGGVIHGGGANRSSAPRRGLTVSYNLAWLAQAEKLLLTVPPDLAAQLPEELQRLIGYQIHRPNLGWIEGQDPLAWLNGDISQTAAAHDNFSPAIEDALRQMREVTESVQS